MSNNIASERVRLGLTQETLGKRLGVSSDVIRNWEDGTTNFKINDAISLVELFGCSLDYLVSRTDERLPRVSV